MNRKYNLEKLIAPKGTIIQINGFPFELPQDTNILGLQENLDLALNWKPSCGPNSLDWIPNFYKNKEIVLNSNNEPIKDMTTIISNTKTYLETKKEIIE